jgi:Protein of unknown function (DUF1236)
MNSRMLKVGVVLGALMLPVAAYPQMISGAIVGGVLGGPIGAVVGTMVGGVNVALLGDYVSTHSVPVYVYNSDVAVGTELPSGVAYYRVPPEYLAPEYYTVVNGHTVLVDPNTRKILAVIN